MTSVRPNPVKTTLDAGGTIYSSSVRLTDPGLCEILGYAGFDFVLLDGEHGAMDPSSIDRLVPGTTRLLVRNEPPGEHETIGLPIYKGASCGHAARRSIGAIVREGRGERTGTAQEAGIAP